MERIAAAACLAAITLALAGCGGGDDSAGADLASYDSATAVVAALNAGGVECTPHGGDADLAPTVFGRDGASGAAQCAPPGESALTFYAWSDRVDGDAVEQMHRTNHCARIASIAYVVGKDWHVSLPITAQVSDGVATGTQDLALGDRVADALGGEVRTLTC